MITRFVFHVHKHPIAVLQLMAPIADHCEADFSLHHLCGRASLDDGAAAATLKWLSDEVHYDFNATVPRLAILQPSVQSRMAIYLGWLIAESKADSLHEDIEKLVNRLSTALRNQLPDAACPMLKVIWAALEDALCVDPNVSDLPGVSIACAQVHDGDTSGRHSGTGPHKKPKNVLAKESAS